MILAILTYIDENIEEPLTLAAIAGRAGYSPYHFSRMFSAILGQPVVEYVRRRKLEHAAVDIASGERILDIALRYGFSSHEGLTRAFKREYGLTPRAFRSMQALRGEGTRVPPLRIPTQERRTSMQIEMRELGQRNVVGYRIQTQPGSAEIVALWRDIMADERWDRLWAKAAQGAMNFGVCIHPDGMEEGRMDYMVAVDHDPAKPADADMELFTIPAARYAVLSVESRGSGIKDGWNALYSTWFPSSGYTYDGDKPDFEAYPDTEHCDIYIPVIPKP